MARKEAYKMVQISQEQHEALTVLSEKLGVSITKTLQMLIETKLASLSKKKGLRITVKKDRDGEIRLELS